MSTSTKQQVVTYLDVNAIQPNPYQPRRTFDQNKLEELAESIERQGLIQPITVLEKLTQDGIVYELVAGERRLRAVRDILGKSRIQVIISKEIKSTEHQEEAALVENIQRDDLSPMEVAVAIKNLIDRQGLTQEQAAKRLGKSRPEVANLLRLLKLPDAVKDMVANGQLEKTKAWKMTRIEDDKKVIDLAKKAINNNWNLVKINDEVEKIINKDVNPAANKEVKSRTLTSDKSKPAIPFHVLVTLDDKEQFDQFVAYLIEQGFKCHVGTEIKQALKPVPESVVQNSNPPLNLDDEDDLTQIIGDLDADQQQALLDGYSETERESGMDESQSDGVGQDE